MSIKITGYGNFFCWNCGKKIKRGEKTCPDCGVKYSGKNKYGSDSALGAGGIGWSDQNRHPCFKNYFKKYCCVVLIWVIGLSILIPTILLLIDDIELDSEGILVIKVIVTMFWVIGIVFLLSLRGRNKPDWEGVVEDKKVIQKTRTRKDKDGRKYKENYTNYVVFIRKQDGSLYELIKKNSSTMYEYFRVGDYVRYHGYRYLNCLEKYDKSLDTIIFCTPCGSVCDARDNFCESCGSVLLKGASVPSES